MKLLRYCHNVLVGLDQFANTILAGEPGETISARSARAAARGHWLGRFMLKWLNWIQPGHGKLAEEGDLRRAEAVEEIEEKALEPPAK